MRAGRYGVLAACVAAAVFTTSASTGSGSVAPCIAVPPLSAAAKQALRIAARGVEKSVTVSPDGSSSTRWTDVADRRYRQVNRGPHGKIRLEFVVIGRRMASVDYNGRTVELDTFPARVPTSLGASAPAVARTYRNSIAKRRALIVGKKTIAGEPTIHVREYETFPSPSKAAQRREAARLLKQLRNELPKGEQLPKNFLAIIAKATDSPPEHWRVETWLDAATYLPLHVRTISDGLLLDNTYNTYLRRTVSNLAKTHLVVPAGFHRYHRPPGGTSTNGIVDSWSYVSPPPVVSGNAATAKCHAP